MDDGRTDDRRGGDRRAGWSRQDERNLRELAEEYTPAAIIGLKLRRSEAAIYAKAAELGVGVAPNPMRR